MKTSVIDVRGMLSALSAHAVEQRMGKVPGVESVTVNDAAGSATVRYDDTLLEIADIKAAVHHSEYQSAGESEPKHVSAHKPARRRAVARPAMSADVAHEMGHSGKDLPAMVRDMRNRFWICLIFTVPLFFYSPMEMFTPPTPPFDLDITVWLFGFATLAIVYPSWPFFVSAWRAIRTGTLGMAALIVLSVGTKLAGIRQSGKNAAPGAPDALQPRRSQVSRLR